MRTHFRLKPKAWLCLLVLGLMLALALPAAADKPTGFDANGNEVSWNYNASNANCAKIQDGTITATDGSVLETGFDQFGYNYQAHSFNGTYDSQDRVIDGKWFGNMGDYVDDSLSLKWSDEWLANVDCDGDGKLDRGLVDGVVGGSSLGWTTNHVVGDYVDAGGQLQSYTYFVKIVWVGAGGNVFGGAYQIIEEVYNDPAGGFTGLYSRAGAPGLGLNDQWTTN
ncbi:MAG: hypothetical protein ACRDHL_01385 [Candidatus Promineifilaceae bacterium]